MNMDNITNTYWDLYEECSEGCITNDCVTNSIKYVNEHFNSPKLKKLHSDSTIPKKGSEYAAGYDLYAYTKDADNKEQEVIIQPGECKLIGTGIAIQPPKGYCAFIMARSGLSTKQGLRPANCVGLCDYDYTGEYKVALYNDSNTQQIIQHGDRIAQLVFMPFYNSPITNDNGFIIVDELEKTERADGGFGHTGHN